jgi:translation initiation factor 2 beta subunit (eIF-2beta)/eIF-5
MNKLDVANEKNKTVLQNLDKVSVDINRDQEMIIFFFKKHFGTSFTLKNGKYSTAKKITAKEFQDALKEFIEYSVLCPKCKLPETHLAIKSSISIKCDCCGHNDKLNTTTASKSMKDVFSHLIKN